MTLESLAHQTLEALEQELAALTTRKLAIESAQESMRNLLVPFEVGATSGSVDWSEVLPAPTSAATVEASAPVAPVVQAEQAPILAPAQESPAKSPRRVQSPLPTDAAALTGTARRVYDAIAKSGPLTPRGLSEVVQMSGSALGHHLTRLIEAGLVIGEGQTTKRVLRVASAPPAAPAASADAGGPAASDLDETVLEFLSKSPSTFEEIARHCLAARTPESHEALKRSLRRLTLRNQILDVGAAWRVRA